MSNDVIQMQYDHMDKIAQEFQHDSEASMTLIQMLQRGSAALRSGWNGQGAAAFFNELEGDTMPAVQRLVVALDAAHSVTLQIKQLMQIAEEEAAAAFKGRYTGTASAGNVVGLQAQAGAGGANAPAWATTILPGGPVFDASGNLVRLNLTTAEFEMLTAQERIQWVEALEDRMTQMNPDRPGENWFHNIQDIIAFFDESPAMDHMAPGSWASMADAGVLQAMQNGRLLHESRGIAPPGFNPCAGSAAAWQQFFDAQADPRVPDAQVLPLWAMAEQQGVNYGDAVAAGIRRPALANEFVAYGNMYRFIARFENGGNDFVNGYSQRTGAGWGGAISEGFGTAADAVVDFLSPIPGIGTPFRDASRAIGSTIGGLTADVLIPDTFGQGFFNPRTVITPDTYSDPAAPPRRSSTGVIIPIPGDIGLGHGPTYYLAHGVEKGLIPAMPGISVGPAGDMTLDNGTRIDARGDATLLDGTRILTNGDIIRPDGTRLDVAGTRMNPDGSYTLIDGTVIR